MGATSEPGAARRVPWRALSRPPPDAGPLASTHVEIRQVRPDEHEALGRLTVAAYEKLEGGEELGEYAKTLADVDDRSRFADVLVAVDGEGVLGGVTYVPGPTNPYAEGLKPGEVGIRMLAVSPAAQGRGIGRALVMACLDRARR